MPQFVAIFHGAPDPRFQSVPQVFDADNPQMAQRRVEAELQSAGNCTGVTLYAAISEHTKTSGIQRTATNRRIFGNPPLEESMRNES